MLIRVRTLDGKDTSIDISKCSTSLEDLQGQIEKILKIKKEKQLLYFAGKQLVNNNRLIDYGIDHNHVLILREKIDLDQNAPQNKLSEDDSEHRGLGSHAEEVSNSNYFKVGDLIDAMDEDGSWSNGKITKIILKTNGSEQSDESDESAEHLVSFNDSPDSISVALTNIRPRMECTIKFSDIKVGDEVLANYNVEEPRQRGHWYIMDITNKTQEKRSRRLVGTLQPSGMQGCEIHLVNEVYRVENRVLLKDRTADLDLKMSTQSDNCRKPAVTCTSCFDNSSKKCRDCSCNICGGKEDEHLQLLCQECEQAYHTTCLKPPLEAVPEDDWYCPQCRNEDVIVKPGEALLISKKKQNRPSAQSEKPARDWGRGMACVGRSKKCTIVKENYFGEIPGVEVGTTWKFRMMASEAGVHRPPVSGIHGRETEGAYSIVLSGGYEDDVDNGDEFLYTGSGGRDLSGNKRTSEQCCDQELTRMNMALARNCNAPVDKENGAVAKDWKKGKPVRVLRKQQSKKHPSKYAPEEGFRYDGLYKVVKYFPVKGASGYTVWRYKLKRDDPTPAPWTSEGKARTRSLGLKLILPEGYEDARKEEKSSPTKSLKRRRSSTVDENSPVKKKKKNENTLASYRLPKDLLLRIKKDVLNEHVWKNIKESAKGGKAKFIEAVQEAFKCVCCLELAGNPVTTDCKHTMCKSCLTRAFSSVGSTCPHCRFELSSSFKMSVNETLTEILCDLLPGYSVR